MPYQLSKIKVLVLEDNAHMRKLLKGLLDAIGVREIVDCSEGAAAYQAIKQNPVDFALVDWETYPVLTFSEVPLVEVHLIDRRDEEPLGAGETPTGPTAAAVANALAHALGVRVNAIPPIVIKRALPPPIPRAVLGFVG
jgi:DNA-binding NarL/FixJ family response regulator